MKHKLLPVADYALACGKISIYTIYSRIRLGKIVPEIIDGGIYIDIIKYPPVKRYKVGRNKLKAR